MLPLAALLCPVSQPVSAALLAALPLQQAASRGQAAKTGARAPPSEEAAQLGEGAPGMAGWLRWQLAAHKHKRPQLNNRQELLAREPPPHCC